jgi:FkbM family methyltransferase
VSLLKTVVERALRTRGWIGIPEWRLPQLPLEQHLKRVFAAYRIDCVLDVGANLGQFRDTLRDGVGYAGPILSFEPVREYIEILQKRAAADRLWRILPYALGSEAATKTITLFSAPGLPSLLPTDVGAMHELLPNVRVTGDEQVVVRRLDEAFREATAGMPCARVFLKLDTQGYDLEVIKGAAETLHAVSAIQTELSMLHIYESMPDYRTSIDVLNSHGYEISGLFPVAHDAAMRVIEMDCVMVRRADHSGT